jgi:hypothetical protein
MPFARASGANCCFQASKPVGELPHCAALAALEAPIAVRAARMAAVRWVRTVIGGF